MNVRADRRSCRRSGYGGPFPGWRVRRRALRGSVRCRRPRRRRRLPYATARAASPVSGGRSYPRTSSRDFEKGGSIAYRLSYAVFLPRHARIDLRPSATPAGHHGPTRDGAEAGGPRRGATYCTARGYLYIRPIYAPRRSRRPTRLSRDDYRTGQDYTFLIDTRTRWPFPRISRACLRR